MTEFPEPLNLLELFHAGMDRQIPPFAFGPMDGHILNLGAGNKRVGNALPLQLPEWDAERAPIPYPDETVSTIYAFHFMEHLRDPIALLAEAQRVLMPGGVMNIVVPYYNSSMQAQDLTHKAAYNEESWRVLFRNPYYSNFDAAGEPLQWRFKVGLNVIMGVVERNLALLTQLIKE